MLADSYALSFGPEARAALVEERLTVLGAAFFHATCIRCPTSLKEVIVSLGAHGLTAEEVRAGCSEALLAGFVYSDGSPFREGDAAFFWPRRRAGD
jgi:hypothetical protein